MAQHPDTPATPPRSTAATMRAVVQQRYGPPEEVLRLQQVPVPAIAPDEVLVRVRATGVNTPDWIVTLGRPAVLRVVAGLRRPVVPVRGTDVAGVVEAVGAEVADLHVGQEVVGSSWHDSVRDGAGAWAELVAVRASQLVEKPAWLSFEDAAASVMSGVTARSAIEQVADVQPRQTVLVNGASGGVGTFAVQLAAARGAEVTGVCSGRNADLVRGLGAADVIDHTVQDITTTGRRWDVVLDDVLNHPPRRVLPLVADGGIALPNSVGPTDWLLGPLLAGLPRVAAWGLRAKVGRDRRVRFTGEESTRENLTAVLDRIASKDVRPVIDRVVPLAEAPRAVAHMASHRARGNIVITV